MVVNVSGWGTPWATPLAYIKKKGIEFSACPTRILGQERLTENQRPTANADIPGKWPLKRRVTVRVSCPWS